MSVEELDLYHYETTSGLTLHCEYEYVSVKLEDLVSEVDKQRMLDELLGELVIRFGTRALIRTLTNLITQENT
jgi:hypothetical protein